MQLIQITYLMSLSFLRELTRAGQRIFTLEEARAVGEKLGLKASYVSRLLYLLVQSRALRLLTRGSYALANDLLSGSPLTPYEIAMHLVPQGAIAYWSAMLEHNLSDQNLTTVFILKPYRTGVRFPRISHVRIESQIYTLVPAKEKDFWGIEARFLNEIPFRVTDLERTLLDGLRKPEYCGGFREVLFAFEQALSRIQDEKLQTYAAQCPRATQKRLGWVLEKLAVFPHLQTYLEVHPSTTYDKLDPQGERRGAYHIRWKLIENL